MVNEWSFKRYWKQSPKFRITTKVALVIFGIGILFNIFWGYFGSNQGDTFIGNQTIYQQITIWNNETNKPGIEINKSSIEINFVKWLWGPSAGKMNFYGDIEYLPSKDQCNYIAADLKGSLIGERELKGTRWTALWGNVILTLLHLVTTGTQQYTILR